MIIHRGLSKWCYPLRKGLEIRKQAGGREASNDLCDLPALRALVLGLSGMDGSGRFQNAAVFLTDLMNKQTYMGRRGDLGGH